MNSKENSTRKKTTLSPNYLCLKKLSFPSTIKTHHLPHYSPNLI